MKLSQLNTIVKNLKRLGLELEKITVKDFCEWRNEVDKTN
jgi:hypothetical protein